MKLAKLYFYSTLTSRKIWYTIFCIFFFSLIYLSCKDKEFAGWLNSEGKHYTVNDKKKYLLFKKYSDNDKTLTKDEFIKMPIFKIHNKYVLETLVGKNFNPIETVKTRQDLFDAFATDAKLDFKDFRNMPVEATKLNINIPQDLVLPFDGTLNLGNAVTDYFDRLYFSIVTQTTLGYGDIFPASRKVRIIAMLQALSTIAIVIL
jgi:hypothetical protein